jgi:large subunit ribosomal protein L24
MKLIKGDTVLITIGKDKGKKGTVEKVFPKNNKVMVEGINQYKRHLKSRTADQKSEIVVVTKPLGVANVALVCPKCNKQTRVGYSMVNDKKKRVCRKCGEEV